MRKKRFRPLVLPYVGVQGGESSGGGTVASIVAGDNVSVDNTDPSNPIVSASGVVEAVVAGYGVSVDNTDPANPIVSAGGGDDSFLYALIF